MFQTTSFISLQASLTPWGAPSLVVKRGWDVDCAQLKSQHLGTDSKRPPLWPFIFLMILWNLSWHVSTNRPTEFTLWNRLSPLLLCLNHLIPQSHITVLAMAVMTPWDPDPWITLSTWHFYSAVIRPCLKSPSSLILIYWTNTFSCLHPHFTRRQPLWSDVQVGILVFILTPLFSQSHRHPCVTWPLPVGQVLDPIPCLHLYFLCSPDPAILVLSLKFLSRSATWFILFPKW